MADVKGSGEDAVNIILPASLFSSGLVVSVDLGRHINGGDTRTYLLRY